MSTVYAERNADGTFASIPLSTGERHKVVLRTLTLDHRYHDDDPIQDAAFTVHFSNGLEVSGQLNKQGKARLVGVPSGPAEVRYGPDARPYQPVKQDGNPDYRAEMGEADIDALIDKYHKG